MANNQQIMNNLRVILGDDVEPNIVSYIATMKHEEDYEEFMENILNKQNTAHLNAYNAIKYQLFGNKLKQKKPSQSTGNNNPSSSQNSNPGSDKSKDNQSAGYGKKNKKKFKDIKEYQEQKKEKEGRHCCDCMGQEHEFMNNCQECGRIHCYKEGPGPCLFCGNEIRVRGEVQSSSNTKPLMKPKLNKIFDDDNDYFKINAKKAEGDKRKMVVALDFASRKVIESTQEDAKLRKLLLEDSIEHLKRVEEVYKKLQNQNSGNLLKKHNKVNNELVDLLIQMRHKKPTEKEDLGEEDAKMPLIKYDNQIFDEDLAATVDQGLCLSMHQPYASLLVAGVKKHEGRVWPTNHRGRLWIAAAAKQPEEEEVAALEQFYREFYKDYTLKFPKEYPTSCLLGCVTVEDCLDETAYKEKFGENGESSSPYVMICSNPIILPVFYPISGKHKIYPLDKELHKCAKLALQHAKYL
ncbi:activating signal cointegrator 1 [Anthonomus grandis grandis]|uniref:activating signal cointegrator 1 n=1 Tax=Anthonomus grandis grandis TaxID=2921223 RepID=UPI0021653A03|nr:activating signal cointegrator 1 [Anthonomus grandis grandis]